MSVSLVYVTCGSRDEALAIARQLVDSRLAACANLLDGMTSIYRWQGAVQQDTECLLLLKTRTSLVEPLMARVRELHSYDCPCVVALPVEQGNPAYLQWVVDQTSPPVETAPAEDSGGADS